MISLPLYKGGNSLQDDKLQLGSINHCNLQHQILMEKKRHYLLRSSGIFNIVAKATQKYYYKFRYDTNTILNSESESEAWILGKHLTSVEAIQAEINKTIWMTYRENMGKSQFISNDVGWGCMIRVGQMMLAEAFRRTLDIKEEQNPAYEQQVIKHIISAFVDSTKQQGFGQYSIQTICENAARLFQLNPGSWFNPSNISHCLANIHQNNPLPGTQELMVKIDHSMDVDRWKKDMREDGSRTSLLVVMMCMLGYGKPDKSKIQTLYKIMRLKQFNGMLGGIPSKAFYFIGATKQGRFIYLDPHLVQKASTSQIQFQTYFCDKYLSISPSQLQSSVGISFYLEDNDDLDNLYRELMKMKSAHEDLPFGLMTPTDSNKPTGFYQYQSSGSILVTNNHNAMMDSNAFEVIQDREKQMTEAFQLIDLE